MTPMMGLLMMQLPLEPSSLSMGLAVFMCMPTALSSGIAMTQQVGGNVAMAILLTVTSNVVAVFTMPHVVAFVLGSVAGGFNLDPQALCWQLIQLVLVPCTAGALVRGLVPVTSNVVAVSTIPHVVAFVIGSVAGGFNLEPQALCWQLIQLVLVPCTVRGLVPALCWQLIQLVLVPCTARALVRGLVPGVAGMVDANKKIMGYLSAICLSMVPWMQVRQSAAQVELPLTSLLSVAAYGISAHVFFLIVNFILVRGLNLGKSENAQQQKRIQQVLILLCSQKTLPVAVAVLTKLSAVMGPSVGLGAVAAVICHLSQIIVDSFLVSWWINRYGMLDAPPKAA
eukprot:gene7402-530_t